MVDLNKTKLLAVRKPKYNRLYLLEGEEETLLYEKAVLNGGCKFEEIYDALEFFLEMYRTLIWTHRDIEIEFDLNAFNPEAPYNLIEIEIGFVIKKLKDNKVFIKLPLLEQSEAINLEAILYNKFCV